MSPPLPPTSLFITFFPSFVFLFLLLSVCLSGENGAGSQQKQQQQQHYSSAGLFVANIHHNNTELLHPNTVNFLSRKVFSRQLNDPAASAAASEAFGGLNREVILKHDCRRVGLRFNSFSELPCFPLVARSPNRQSRTRCRHRRRVTSRLKKKKNTKTSQNKHGGQNN